MSESLKDADSAPKVIDSLNPLKIKGSLAPARRLTQRSSEIQVYEVSSLLPIVF